MCKCGSRAYAGSQIIQIQIQLAGHSLACPRARLTFCGPRMQMGRRPYGLRERRTCIHTGLPLVTGVGRIMRDVDAATQNHFACVRHCWRRADSRVAGRVWCYYMASSTVFPRPRHAVRLPIHWAPPHLLPRAICRARYSNLAPRHVSTCARCSCPAGHSHCCRGSALTAIDTVGCRRRRGLNRSAPAAAACGVVRRNSAVRDITCRGALADAFARHRIVVRGYLCDVAHMVRPSARHAPALAVHLVRAPAAPSVTWMRGYSNPFRASATLLAPC
jgi:hypothetical protein